MIPTISELGYENAQLTKKLAISEAKQQALLVEREFWVEQGRNVQNALQTSQRMYADLYDQLGRGVVTDESIKDNLALASEQLCQPLTTVEAIRALTSTMDKATQGQYTASHGLKDAARALDEFSGHTKYMKHGKG
jgi:hypothetical protein